MRDVAVLGVGMHPWGKWGRDFVEYGVVAARAALADAQLDWRDVQLVSGANTIRNGYPGFVSGSTFAQALGWTGARIVSNYAACASGAVALSVAREYILSGACDVALVIGADTTPKGFLAPTAGERKADPDWLRFHLVGATNPTFFGLYARRRMDLYGATAETFAEVRVKNGRHGAENPNARYRKPPTVEEVLASPIVADPLHLFDICATSDGAAAVVLTSLDYAARKSSRPVKLRAVSTVTPTFPNRIVDLPNLGTDPVPTKMSANSVTADGTSGATFKKSIARAAYEEAGLGPEDLSLAEVYDLSSALELDWYEDIGLCAEGEAESLLLSGATAVGGRVPVNASGGLASFGEAVPAQALAQVCELTRQLRGQAGSRQIEDARVGLAVNQGLFGHGSGTILVK